MQILYNSYAHNMHMLWKSCVNHMQHTTIDMNYICILYTNHMHIVYYLHMQVSCLVYIYIYIYIYANHMQMYIICMSFVYTLKYRHIAYANYIQILWNLHMICISYTQRIYKSCANHVRFVYDLHMHIQITWLFFNWKFKIILEITLNFQ